MSKAEGATVAMIAHGGSLDASLRSWLGIARNGHGERRVFTFGNAHRKCGFIEEGCLRQDIYSKGRFHDMLVMGILKQEFLAAGSQ